MPRQIQRWSEAEDRQFVELCKSRKDAAYIAKIMGRSVEAVRQRMVGVKLRGAVKLIRRRYADGYTPSAKQGAALP